MNRAAARRELRKYLDVLRRQDYQSLIQDLGKPQIVTVTGDDGRRYEIEVQIRWEGRPGRDVRVVGLIDDKQLGSAILPVTEDFIVTPDGQVLE
jgi:hypothetical protein